MPGYCRSMQHLCQCGEEGRGGEESKVREHYEGRWEVKRTRFLMCMQYVGAVAMSLDAPGLGQSLESML
jgi:hypothetical protein